MEESFSKASKDSVSYQSAGSIFELEATPDFQEQERLKRNWSQNLDKLQWLACGVTALLSTIFLAFQCKYQGPAAVTRILLLAVSLQILRTTICLTNYFIARLWALPHYIGMTEDDILTFLSPGPLPLDRWLLKYDEGKIIVRDSLQRKIPHMLVILSELGIFCSLLRAGGGSSEVTAASVASSTVSLVLQTLILTLKTTLSDSAWVYSTACLFVCNRIRDGRQRYENNLVVSMTNAWGRIVTNLTWWIVVLPFYDASEAPLLLLVLWFPLAVGDAMAEIIGGCFGRHFFEVYGLGDINRKTLEGVAGMWISSAICTYSVIFQAWSEGGLVTFGLFDWCWWALVATTLATLAETFSPRGTDNLTIPLSSALTFALAGALHAQ
eukprot:TRINITY_DN13989_c0_g1_i1.p1 TRINITY_DN13989_c0_g1~~TRINITY_DN13989_c0_g1_i1.p1  ORF type:complete len:382 (+),score=34.48 TRINITY_DN13989_c0_g1_i1:146-1291(+)